jgi:hypothetical protein
MPSTNAVEGEVTTTLGPPVPSLSIGDGTERMRLGAPVTPNLSVGEELLRTRIGMRHA